MLKGTVPLFNERVDASDPAGTAKTFANMTFVAAVAIGALAAGQWVLNRAGDATGVTQEEFRVL